MIIETTTKREYFSVQLVEDGNSEGSNCGMR
jgi:hypothetical protein